MSLWTLAGNDSEEPNIRCYLIGFAVLVMMLNVFIVVYSNREWFMRRWRKCQARKRRWNREMMRHFGRIGGLR